MHADTDPSNGYEAIAADFIMAREHRNVGASAMRAWAASVRPGGVVLDIGCGAGVPVSQALVDAGLSVCGLDASPTMLARFRERFPSAVTQCAAVEESDFLGRTFDGIIAWGLLFLLPADSQRRVIERMGRHVVPGGRLLFTAPWQVTEWDDLMTGRQSRSLGSDEYLRLLHANGLEPDDAVTDEGDNHYFIATKSEKLRAG